MIPADVVITWVLAAVPDPQRKGQAIDRIEANSSVIATLRESVHAHGRHLVVLHDCLDDADDELTTFVRCPPGGNPYWRRWWLTYQWLHLHAIHVDRAWCVDGTDARMLNDPFPHMAPAGFPGVLMVGSEDKYFGDGSDTDQWLHHHCPSMTAFFDRHEGDQVLNVGLVGGTVDDIAVLALKLAACELSGDDYEMGAFNAVVRGVSAPPFVTGAPVHTPFLSWATSDPECWWAHK